MRTVLPYIRRFTQGVNHSEVTIPDTALMGVTHRNPSLSPGHVQRKERCDQRSGTRSQAPDQPAQRAGPAELGKLLLTSVFCKAITKWEGEGMGKCVLGRFGIIFGGVLAFFVYFFCNTKTSEEQREFFLLSFT